MGNGASRRNYCTRTRPLPIAEPDPLLSLAPATRQ